MTSETNNKYLLKIIKKDKGDITNDDLSECKIKINPFKISKNITPKWIFKSKYILLIVDYSIPQDILNEYTNILNDKYKLYYENFKDKVKIKIINIISEENLIDQIFDPENKNDLDPKFKDEIYNIFLNTKTKECYLTISKELRNIIMKKKKLNIMAEKHLCIDVFNKCKKCFSYEHSERNCKNFDLCFKCSDKKHLNLDCDRHCWICYEKFGINYNHYVSDLKNCKSAKDEIQRLINLRNNS